MGNLMTYGFIGIIGVIIIGFIYVWAVKGKAGKKKVERGMELLQQGDFAKAYNLFASALKDTVGSPDYGMAVKGLARSYKMSGASADVGQLMQYGRDVQIMMKDPRIDKAKRATFMREIHERIDRHLKDLPQL